MNHSADWVAEAVGAVLEGDGSLVLSGVAAPDRAGANDLIYVETPTQAVKASASAAACVVAAQGVDLPSKTILRVARPKVAFAKAAALLRGGQSIARGIHPTAIVAASARLGDGVGLGPFVVVEDDVEIGAGTEIGAHGVIGAGCRIGAHCRMHPRVTLYAGVRIGQRVEIHSGAVIGADGFGYAFDGCAYLKFPQAGIVEIDDDVEIGANTAIDRGSLGDTRLAEGVKLDNLVHVAHNVEIGAHTVIAAQTGISGSCKIGHHVVMAGQVGLGDHCTLENGTIIGGQAGILPGKVVRGGQPQWGTPARSLDKFKEMYVWLARLPDLARRIQVLEKAAKPQA